MGFDLGSIIRDNVKRLTPYSSARSEHSGAASGDIFLDANENSLGSPTSNDYSRYPNPFQTALKKKVGVMNGVDRGQIFIGNGSDEVIDLVIRTVCRPAIDNIVICPPTYGMYEVAAEINDVEVRRVRLTSDFALDTDGIREAIDTNTKLIFLCSPNNPTGNSMSHDEILKIAASFHGLVVVDEAYIHFADQPSLTPEVVRFPNLVVIQTFSKAWGLAGLRVGMAFANRETVELLNKIKPPYNVSQIAQDAILEALDNRARFEETIRRIKTERRRLTDQLAQIPIVTKVHDSEANFLLVRVEDADRVYRFLIERQIIVRNRSNVEGCENCLRITVGTPDENDAVINALAEYRSEREASL
jgi:histidinol-phosphate aminotransferase